MLDEQLVPIDTPMGVIVLLACPHCGKEPVLRATGSLTYVLCEACYSCGPVALNLDDAITAWNRRVVIDDEDPQEEEAEMAKREFLMLAHTFKPAKHALGGWYMSHKLDGMRCFWDGGASRGVLKADVPWANTAKDERYVTPPVATGLWSRYGNVIHAPDWFLDKLPKGCPLDGELYIGPGEGQRQELMKVVKSLTPDDRWHKVTYHLYAVPDMAEVLADGVIKNTNFTKRFTGCLQWWQERLPDARPMRMAFRTQLNEFAIHANETVFAHPQVELPYVGWEDAIEAELQKVLALHGEGLMFRHPDTAYSCQRSYNLLKHKPWEDAEGVVVGYTSGKEGVEGRLLGKMGSVTVAYNGTTFDLSGFTEAERELSDPAWAEANPGTWCPDSITCDAFPRGSIITFKYRELTADGKPVEARYLRKWEAE